MAKQIKNVPVMQQIREAAQNRPALTVGGLLGGGIPSATFYTSHFMYESFWSIETLIVLGGLIVSAKTVAAWCEQAWQDRQKAVGTVLLAELFMLKAPLIPALIALAYLVSINAVASGCILALSDKKKSSKKAAAKPTHLGAAANDNSGITLVKRPRRKAA